MEPIENKVDYLEPSVQSTPPLATDTTAMPSATTENIKYAGFWIRLVAYLLDGLVLAVPILVINFGLLFLSRGSFPYLNYLARGVDFLITYTYFVWMTFKYQATLGKMAVGLVVVSDKSSTLTSGQVLLREISKIISALVIYLGYIMAGFTKRKQALHDMIASTTVRYKKPDKKLSGVVIAAIVVSSLLVAIGVIGILAAVILNSLTSAKNKAKAAIDEPVKTALFSEITAAISFRNLEYNFKNFTLAPIDQDASCSGNPVVNISPDSNQLAIFMKSCADPQKYYCLDAISPWKYAIKEVDKNYAESGAYFCDSQQMVREKAAIEKDGNSAQIYPSTNQDIASDDTIKAFLISDIATAQNPINAGKSLEGVVNPIKIACSGNAFINLSPDKLRMAIFRRSCQNPTVYYCLDTNSQQPYDNDFRQVDKNFVDSGAYLCNHSNTDVKNTQDVNATGKNNLTNTFTSENGDFSISYPADWISKKTNLFDSWVEFYPIDRTNNQVLELLISEMTVPSGEKVSDVLNNLIEAHTKNGITNIETKDFIYNFDDGSTAVSKQIIDDVNLSEIPRKDWVIFVPVNQKIYSFAYIDKIDKFDDDKGLIVEILNSWKIKK